MRLVIKIRKEKTGPCPSHFVVGGGKELILSFRLHCALPSFRQARSDHNREGRVVSIYDVRTRDPPNLD